jgi:hypothetical protein
MRRQGKRELIVMLFTPVLWFLRVEKRVLGVKGQRHGTSGGYLSLGSNCNNIPASCKDNFCAEAPSGSKALAGYRSSESGHEDWQKKI